MGNEIRYEELENQVPKEKRFGTKGLEIWGMLTEWVRIRGDGSLKTNKGQHLFPDRRKVKRCGTKVNYTRPPWLMGLVL